MTSITMPKNMIFTHYLFSLYFLFKKLQPIILVGPMTIEGFIKILSELL